MPDRYLALGGLWFVLAAVRVYHLHTGEATLAWSTGLPTVAYVLSGCYFLRVGVRNAG